MLRTKTNSFDDTMFMQVILAGARQGIFGLWALPREDFHVFRHDGYKWKFLFVREIVRGRRCWYQTYSKEVSNDNHICRLKFKYTYKKGLQNSANPRNPKDDLNSFCILLKNESCFLWYQDDRYNKIYFILWWQNVLLDQNLVDYCYNTGLY